MDLKDKHITWVGNIYRKFEAVCQEVDDIVGKDAVKSFENRVQNNVKNLYSNVVQELLPIPHLVNSAKYEAPSAALKNNIDTSVKSAGSVEDANNVNKPGEEENLVNNLSEPLWDSDTNDTNDLANDQKAHASIKLDLASHVSDETYFDSLEAENSYLTQEDVGNHLSTETSEAEKENLQGRVEKTDIMSTPPLVDSLWLKEKEPLEFLTFSESFNGSSDSGCGVSAGRNGNLDVNVEQNSCSIVEIEKNEMISSTYQALSFTSVDEQEPFEASLFSEPSDAVNKDTCGILAKVSPATSAALCERPVTQTEPLCFECSLISDSLYSKPLASYSFEIDSCNNNSGDVAWCISDSSPIHVCCKQTPHVSGQIMKSQDGLVSSGSSQSMESNEKNLHFLRRRG